MPTARSPRGRARQPLSVPNLGDDAAERKRVLNVLAQRRYRARKRESKGSSVSDQEMLVDGITRSKDLSHDLKRRKSCQPESSFNRDVSQPTTGESALEADLTTDVGIDIDFDFEDWNTQIMRPDLPLDLSWPLLDMEPLPLFPASYPPSDVSLSPSFTRSASILAPLFQDYQAATTTFPDTYLLPIPALALLRACLTNATRLGIAKQMWDYTSISPYYTGIPSHFESSSDSSISITGSDISIDNGIDIATLPENLRPTRTQRMLPHHPMLDILPWPSVRNKLIMFFSQPEELRPAELGMQQLVEDMEDEAEGVVVKAGGTEPWEVQSWEVGRAVEKRWWFVLDRTVKRRQ